MWRLIVPVLALVSAATVVSAQRGTTSRAPSRRLTTVVKCAVDLGTGVKSKRRFCDVVIASSGAESVTMTIPAHTGSATLMFDLHNRFTVPPASVDVGRAFLRQVSIVSVIRPTGEVIDRAAVGREYRSPSDLFDRIGSGGAAGDFKAVAPGPPQPVRLTIPAGVPAIGIVGTRIDEWRLLTRGSFDAPGRPIAMVSALRIEYTPR